MADTVKITCTNNDRVVEGKVLSRSMKRILVEVAVGGSRLELVLTRDDPRRPFVGRIGGLEFTAPALTRP